ncbi:DUF4038 domain-containing protein [Pseudonocardiaceae bacterium YIM PH 21723]|nr:DUF4038 domain-containing protein [Pseudonocardiaceae bacterium YIM PH 21723]
MNEVDRLTDRRRAIMGSWGTDLRRLGTALLAGVLVLSLTQCTGGREAGSDDAMGPLRVSERNSRYFQRPDGTTVYLTGSHTWASFQDNGSASFDYPQYLNFLRANGHNFFRLWTWEQTRWTNETGDDNYRFSPDSPFRRVGPGKAMDGGQKFDLTQFDDGYFQRLRDRVVQAQQNGIYVSVMLFNGWSVERCKAEFCDNNPWKGHPLNGNNNVNGINGDRNGDGSGAEVHQLANGQVTQVQDNYVRRVIQAVGDLGNVLYEVSNESSAQSVAWQYHMIDLVKATDSRHPVGMTTPHPFGDNNALYGSRADWISPTGGVDDDTVAPGGKVSILDTDHLCGVCGNPDWVWRSFTRGHNPILMDDYDGSGYGVGATGPHLQDNGWNGTRAAMGQARTLADRIDLGGMEPRPDSASSGHLLAKNTEYVAYTGDSWVSVDLSRSAGMTLGAEWLRPDQRSGPQQVDAVTPDQGSTGVIFNSPWGGPGVLHLWQK